MPLPTTPEEAVAFVRAVMEEPDGHAHGNDAGKAGEHMAVLDLVPRDEATHVAISNGDWFDPSTWFNGQIPGEDAKVLIPRGVSVRYDGESDDSIFTVRVDGELRFATNTDTKLVLDTMVVSPSGRLEIGTADHPIEPGVTVDIVIADNGDIDTGWDPMLLSRGIVSHGEAEIYGAEKTSFLKVSDAPMAGDRQISLQEVPEGWQVGDTIVISGTHKQGWAWDNAAGAEIWHESEDEEVVITAINGDTITIDRALEHDHDTPREDLFAYVANMTRNITVSSENGEATEVGHRGHVMFMHSDDVDVRYAAFEDLGRTDKSREAFDVGDIGSVSSDSNVKGRYAFHFHKTGTDSLDDPAIAIGNTVSGSPGWGFVHHSSNANFIDNVAFDVFGAAFAAEDGDETGVWLRNMAIKAEGYDYGDVPAKLGLERHDNGRTGDGFFFAGRLVEAAENVAVNTTHGFVWMHRSAPTDATTNTLQHPEIAYGQDEMHPDHPAIQGFRDNEAFGNEFGLIVLKANTEQGHDVRSIFEGFTAWEVRTGVDLSYTGHYTLKDFDLIGTYTGGFYEAQQAVHLGTNAFDMVFNGLTAENFDRGINFNTGYTFNVPESDIGFVVIDADMTDVGQEFVGHNPSRSTIMTSSQLNDGRLSFEQPVVTVGSNQDIVLHGTKTDSIGTTERIKAGDPQTIYRWEVPELLREIGYYTTQSGQKVALIPDLVADRATGELLKFSYVVNLNISDGELASYGATNHGLYDPNNPAPIAGNDQAQTMAGQEVVIDVTANDRDSDGGAVIAAGAVDPAHGNVMPTEDGRLVYIPDEDFVGQDTFVYWAADEEGNYTPATVTIDVWDM